MIKLITLNQPRMAQAFIDYMASRQVDIKMMPEGGGQFALWLVDSQHQVETAVSYTHLTMPTNREV